MKRCPDFIQFKANTGQVDVGPYEFGRFRNGFFIHNHRAADLFQFVEGISQVKIGQRLVFTILKSLIIQNKGFRKIVFLESLVSPVQK
jgi:hypothetical protein